MSYQALYRVWRPQRFDEMVGQEAIAQTLKNAIAHHMASHAYLFTGPRGTGKTSAAKIFAKAINCPHQEDGEPCNICELCQGITRGTVGDVIEIDAASNNGVEEIRDIRDKVRYTPTQATYKVYIIDEVHMLSTGAFNALLKTLEEPPAHVIFILATTEPHKIPATIISRTQRFDFKRIRPQAIEGRLREILDANDRSYEDGVLEMIARAANGGMRDALSLLDQMLSFEEGTLDNQTARLVTGSLSEDQMLAYTEAIENGDTKAALTQLHDIFNNGQETGRFIEEMLGFIRDLLLSKEIGQEDTDLTRHFNREFFTLAKRIALDVLYRMMDQFQLAQREIRFMSQPVMMLEMLTMQLATGTRSTERSPVASDQAIQATLDMMQREIDSLKAQLADNIVTPTPTPSGAKLPADKDMRDQSVGFKPNMHLIYQTLSKATNTHRHQIESIWEEVVQSLPNMQRALLDATFPVAASPEYFVVRFDYEILCAKVNEDETVKTEVSKKINQLVNHPGKMLVVTTAQWEEARQQYVMAYKAGHLEELIGASEVTQAVTPEAEEMAMHSEEEAEDMAEPMLAIVGEDQITMIDD